MFNNIPGTEQNKLAQSLSLLALVAAALLVAMLVSEIRSYKFIGQGVSPTNTITVSGDGEVFVAPDIANVSFSVLGKGATLSAAQEKVNQSMAKIIDSFTKIGILEKDIKSSPTFRPVYAYPDQKACQSGGPCYYPYDSNRNIVGYEVEQLTYVKIRNIDDVSKALSGLVTLGATNMSDITFSVDDEDKPKAEARIEAITKAKTKAEQLARDLGVKLVRIVSFSENGNYPMYYRTDSAMMEKGVGGSVSAPVISTGENKITSSVSITYEIR